MKRSFLMLPALATVAGALFFGAVGFAADTSTQPSPDAMGPGHLRRSLVRQLDLTADQRQAIKDVLRTHQPVLRPLREETQAGRAALGELIAAPTLDETALAAQADRLAATNRELIIASAHLRADLRKILTPEQAAKLDDLGSHAKARGRAGRGLERAPLMEP